MGVTKNGHENELKLFSFLCVQYYYNFIYILSNDCLNCSASVRNFTLKKCLFSQINN